MIYILLLFQLALPNPLITPGAAVVDLKLEQICPDQTRLMSNPIINETIRDKVLAMYDLLGRGDFFIDFLIPFELGGTNEPRNLWPIPYASRRDTLIRKVELEHKLHEMVCNGSISLDDAQNIFRFSWVEGYRRFVLR